MESNGPNESTRPPSLECPACGNSKYTSGFCYGLIPLRFKALKAPDGRWFDFGKNVRAKVCNHCGHIQLCLEGSLLDRSAS